MKVVQQLDHEGYFVGSTEADESPLEPGVFLLPASAVEAEAPTPPDGHRARWDGEAWSYEELPKPLAPPQSPEPGPLTPAAQIAALESQHLLPRATREFMLLTMEHMAAQQGITPQALYVANPGYRKVKDLDNQINALREQLS